MVTLLWLLIKQKEQFYLRDLYWGCGIILLSLSAIVLQGFLEIFDFHVRQTLVNSLALLIGINVLLSSN